MKISRLTCLMLLLCTGYSVVSAQTEQAARQIEIYGGLARLPFPQLRPPVQLDPDAPNDSLGTYFMDPEREQMAFFGLGYRQDWDNGRYVLISVPRLVLGQSRTQQIGRIATDRRFIQQQLDYVSLRGEFGKRYRTQQAVSFLLGFGLEGVYTQTSNVPDVSADSYASYYRLLASQLIVTAQAQWKMRGRWSLLAGIDPLVISLGVEERYAENPQLDRKFWTNTLFDVDFITGNHLHIGLAYGLE